MEDPTVSRVSDDGRVRSSGERGDPSAAPDVGDLIRKIAASPEGCAARKRQNARWNLAARKARDRFERLSRAEYARHEAKLKALRSARDAALEAARKTAQDEERSFFDAAIAKALPVPPRDPPDASDEYREGE